MRVLVLVPLLYLFSIAFLPSSAMGTIAPSEKEYFEYLKQRSQKALIYRNHYLYPKITKRLFGNKILDFGSGLGDFLKYRPGTVGADINRFSVEWGESEGLDIHPIQQGRTPFLNSSFDSIILDNVLEHIIHPNKTLQEITRILRIDGHLIIGVPGIKGFNSDSDHKVYYDKDNLTALLEKHGYSLVDTFYTPLKSNFLSERLSLYALYATYKKTSAQCELYL